MAAWVGRNVMQVEGGKRGLKSSLDRNEGMHVSRGGEGGEEPACSDLGSELGLLEGERRNKKVRR